MRFGWVEILLVIGIIVLLFGAKKIPELMRGIGRGTREFKEGLKGDDDTTKNSKTS
jgi:sec-independent protein translocase protein TatA